MYESYDSARIISIPIDRLVDPPDNPNRMDVEKRDLLEQAISGLGFVQPVLARPLTDDNEPIELPAQGSCTVAEFRQAVEATMRLAAKFVIIDGVHRVQAAKAVGMTEVPCCLVGIGAEEARIAQIGMNRLRGELDLSAVAHTLATLHADGWSVEDLSLTGFTTSEIDSLLKTTEDASADITPEMGAVPNDDDSPVKPFVLELTFATRAELARAKRALRKAGGGKGADLAVGLLRLVDGA